jgi:hypothetical protein
MFIVNFIHTIQQKKSKTHFFPFAMWTNKLMPPPNTVQNDLGERRQVRTVFTVSYIHTSIHLY